MDSGQRTSGWERYQKGVPRQTGPSCLPFSRGLPLPKFLVSSLPVPFLFYDQKTMEASESIRNTPPPPPTTSPPLPQEASSWHRGVTCRLPNMVLLCVCTAKKTPVILSRAACIQCSQHPGLILLLVISFSALRLWGGQERNGGEEG